MPITIKDAQAVVVNGLEDWNYFIPEAGIYTIKMYAVQSNAIDNLQLQIYQNDSSVGYAETSNNDQLELSVEATDITCAEGDEIEFEINADSTPLDLNCVTTIINVIPQSFQKPT